MKINLVESLILFITSLLLGWIIYDDFRYRTIRVILLPVIFLLLLLHRLQLISFSTLLVSLLFNMFYICLLSLLAVGYLFLRHKISWSGVSSFIGLGDLLFMVSICIWFDAEEFIVFTIVSLLVALLGNFFWKNATIPLAGYQSLCFLIFYTTTALPI